MFFAGKTISGTHLFPKWWVYFFGGNWKQKTGGYGWRPNIFRLISRYYRENWRNAGYSLSSWLQFNDCICKEIGIIHHEKNTQKN